MSLGALHSEPPPFFRQGASAVSQLAVYSAFAIFLMVADARFKMVQPVRATIATVLYPLQLLAMQPVKTLKVASEYFSSLDSAQAVRNAAQTMRITQSLSVNQAGQLMLENERLRKLLGMRERFETFARPAQVLYDAADPYTRKVVIDRGFMQQAKVGSPVVDETGVIGQVTRVYPLVSEVTLLTDRDLAIPVLNIRTGARGVAYGDAANHANAMELRFMAANADVVEGDMLTTSGVDGVYPAGLPVARIDKIERRVDAAFARVYCTPVAYLTGTSHVLVIDPVTDQMEPRPGTEPTTPPPITSSIKSGVQK
jgi:rod shape-determining protein MreC